MNRFVFIRHGETAMAGRFCGHSNPDLNPAGELQIIRVAELIRDLGVDRICSSDLLRASRTAEAISMRIGIPVELRHDLREIDFGGWEGLNWQDIEIDYPDEARRWVDEFPARSAPDGEPYASFTTRIDAAISSLLSETSVVTAIVTHRGVMRYALAKYFGLTEDETWTKTASYGAVVIAEACSCNCEVSL